MNLDKKLRFKVFLGALALLVQGAAVPVLATVPTIGISYLVGFSDISEAFGTAMRWGVFLALLVSGLYLIWAGFKYVTAGDDPKNAEAARTQMSNAVVGVIIVASVYLIMKIMTMIIPGLDQIMKI